MLTIKASDLASILNWWLVQQERCSGKKLHQFAKIFHQFWKKLHQSPTGQHASQTGSKNVSINDRS